ncbi:hypothetical protein, partial [Azospirillum argentinense]|uniref:hypothetical protein n=1 Tax=Azospirillum argentinense TaxID=2970906 RepID=UPI001B3B7458
CFRNQIGISWAESPARFGVALWRRAPGCGRGNPLRRGASGGCGWARRQALARNKPRPATAAIALVGLSAALRVAAASTAPDLLMPAAALAWMAAHLLVLWVLLRVPKRIRA